MTRRQNVRRISSSATVSSIPQTPVFVRTTRRFWSSRRSWPVSSTVGPVRPETEPIRRKSRQISSKRWPPIGRCGGIPSKTTKGSVVGAPSQGPFSDNDTRWVGDGERFSHAYAPLCSTAISVILVPTIASYYYYDYGDHAGFGTCNSCNAGLHLRTYVSIRAPHDGKSLFPCSRFPKQHTFPLQRRTKRLLVSGGWGANL